MVNSVDAHGWGALHYSAASGSLEVSRTLVQWGADVNATLPDFSTPLMLTLEEGHIAVAQLLLDEGAKIKCRDENGFTAQDRCDYRVSAELGRILQLSTRSRPPEEAGLENRPPPFKEDPSGLVPPEKPLHQRCPSTLLHEVQTALPLHMDTAVLA